MEKSSVSAMRVSHLGKILSNFAILGAALCAASVVSFLLIAVYYTILIAILIGTLFLIIFAYPNFIEFFNGGEQMTEIIVMFSNTCVPIIAPVTAAVSALAIAALALSKQRNTGRIVVSTICLLIAVVFTAIYTLAGGIAK